MKNKKYEIDAAMALKKYYCYKCGSLLRKQQRKRLIRKGDPDYKEHRTVGRMIVIGDIELNEYDFICPVCKKIIKPDEQYVIEIIQNKLNNYLLTEKEYTDNLQYAKNKLYKRKFITDKIVKIVFLILTILIIFYCIFY